MGAADYFGSVSGYREPGKFVRTGLKAVKSSHVDAPIIEGSPLVIECELKEFVRTMNFSTVIVIFIGGAKSLSRGCKCTPFSFVSAKSPGV